MTKKRTLVAILPLIFIISIVAFPIIGLGKSRQEYAADFLKSTQDEIWGAFSEYIYNEDDETEMETPLSTRSALGGLYLLDALSDLETTRLKTWLLERLNWGIDYNNLQNASECIESLYYIDEIASIGTVRKNDFKEFSANRSEYTVSGELGYALDEDLEPTIFGTYFVVKGYYFLDYINELEVTNITNFVVNSLEPTGGFKASPISTGSSLTATFFAIQTLKYLNTLNLLEPNKSQISQYINEFFVEDQILESHYGGYTYIPEIEMQFATVSATYDAVIALSLLGTSVPIVEATAQWILRNQNQVDGGFSENALEGVERRSSSITTYQSIRILSELGQLDLLSEQFGDYKLRWWIVLIVVIVILGGSIGGIIYYQRRIRL